MAPCNILFLFLLVTFLTFATTATHSINDLSNDTMTVPQHGSGGLTPVTAPISDYIHLNCSSERSFFSSGFQSNLEDLFSFLSSEAASNNRFSIHPVNGENPSDSAFGMFMCRGDVTPDLCLQCVENAKEQLTQDCSSSQQAVIWYDECTVRYSNISFFYRADTSPAYAMPRLANVSDPKNFSRLLHLTLNNIVGQASSNDNKFATTQAKVPGSQSLYCLAQCTHDLSPSDCKTCLSAAIRELPSCCEASEGGSVLYPSCNVRYEFYPFFDSNSSSTQTPPWVPASHFSYANSTYLHHNCSSDHEPAKPAFERDLKILFSHMSSNATVANKSFYKGNVESSVNGLFMCRGDLPSLLCQQCVANATLRISSLCNSSRQAVIWFSYCMLRYSDKYFFSNMETSPSFQKLNVTTPSTHVPTQGFFNNKLSNTIEDVAEKAGDSDGKFVNKSLKLNPSQTLYALGQCTQHLSSDQCKACLESINTIIPWTRLGSVGGMVLYPNCNIRFELFQFYMTDQPPKDNPSPSRRKDKKKGHARTMILIIVVSTTSVTFFSISYYLIKRKGRKNSEVILREKCVYF
ncbi:hypothetical protein Fmac_029014 [Flemingia macrophylla]|uniref:Gnk2-homologous domain-containing protein n=1 Tax=Flemingia macrophylla TaxID=520843 RepID=A0ABD1LAL0_9FABA